jgi:hypothetical protein
MINFHCRKEKKSYLMQGEVTGWSCREECLEVNGGTATARSWQLALVVGGEEDYG